MNDTTKSDKPQKHFELMHKTWADYRNKTSELVAQTITLIKEEYYKDLGCKKPVDALKKITGSESNDPYKFVNAAVVASELNADATQYSREVFLQMRKAKKESRQEVWNALIEKYGYGKNITAKRVLEMIRELNASKEGKDRKKKQKKRKVTFKQLLNKLIPCRMKTAYQFLTY